MVMTRARSTGVVSKTKPSRGEALVAGSPAPLSPFEPAGPSVVAPVVPAGGQGVEAGMSQSRPATRLIQAASPKLSWVRVLSASGRRVSKMLNH